MLSRVALKQASVLGRVAASRLPRVAAPVAFKAVSIDGESCDRPFHANVAARFELIHRRLASTAAAVRPVEEEDEFFQAVETPAARQSESAVEPPASTEPLKEVARFASLRGSISYDTLKALTVRPFKLVEMSEVQRRVLGLLPELVGGSKRAEDQPQAGEQVEAATEAREQGEESRKEDLLVKAKTGTGKTIVSGPCQICNANGIGILGTCARRTYQPDRRLGKI
jgi:ATP-dependent RNA helicase MSS116